MTDMYIAFAPLQGYTDAVYRRAHRECVGGVDEYYTPFVRIEKGEVRKKDLRDIDPAANTGVPTVPQVIAKDGEEFARLCDVVQGLGWRRIDLNMGCPFPMQVKAGRGSGLLQHPEMPLVHVTLHPRMGRQQYKGTVDKDAFWRFVHGCRHPMVYNGDISLDTPLGQMQASDGFPDLWEQRTDEVDGSKIKGVMIGRGLLARPWMTHTPPPFGSPSPKLGEELVKQMHERIYRHAVENLCGDSQILSHLHAFWEYLEIDRKHKKAIMKSSTLSRYNEAVAVTCRLGVCR